MGPPGDESAGGPARTPRRTAEGARGHAPRRSPTHRTEILMRRTRTTLTLGVALATFALAGVVGASASPARERSARPRPEAPAPPRRGRGRRRPGRDAARPRR